MCIAHHFCRKFTEMAKLSMRISYKSFCIVDHGLNWSIRPVCCSMINVNSLKLTTKRTDVRSAESYNILANKLNFRKVLIF